MERTIPDNKNGVPTEHYKKQFALKSPEEMSIRSGFPYKDGRFGFWFLNREVFLTYPEMELCDADGKTVEAANLRILLARAVMEGKKKTFSGTYRSYSEMPWGEVYLLQFRGRCIMRLAFSFGNKLEAFAKACTEIGGIECKGADKAFAIEFLDGFFVKLLLWAGDDEFPPSAQMLFSDNFPEMFKAEDIAVVGDILINELKSIQ